MLKSKIHRATVTDANLNYEGSLTIDKELMMEAELIPFEQIMVYNISNGERFETYVIEGEAGKRQVCLNGAAARKGDVGDLIIVASYGLFDEEDMKKGKSIVVCLDSNNHIKKRSVYKWRSFKG